MPNDWLHPQWPAPSHVKALCTTRVGGVSAAPFDSLNLGDHVGDDPAAVAANRHILQSALQAISATTRPVFLQQVHGIETIVLQPQTADGSCADACVSTTPQVACTIMVADCLPVLLTDGQGQAVAAAHAGWRGLAAGVLESTFATLTSQVALRAAAPTTNTSAIAANSLAWLGPCIGRDFFEVGPEVYAAFCTHDSAAQAYFQSLGAGKYLADLAALARLRLQALGITRIYGNDSSAGWCTVANPSRFFSYRRDGTALGSSGRMAACIWLSGNTR